MTKPLEDGNPVLVKRIFQNARFVRSLGIELTTFGEGWCETRLQVLPEHQQQHGFIHAGVLMTMADHTSGGAAVTSVPPGKDVITVENKTSFLRPASGAVLTCRAQVLRAGKNLIFVEAEVTTHHEKQRQVVAKASSTLAVIPLRQEADEQPSKPK